MSTRIRIWMQLKMISDTVVNSFDLETDLMRKYDKDEIGHDKIKSNQKQIFLVNLKDI